MKPLGEFELWFVTGSQEMSGESVLRRNGPRLAVGSAR
jgi:hypothetical protein